MTPLILTLAVTLILIGGSCNCGGSCSGWPVVLVPALWGKLMELASHREQLSSGQLMWWVEIQLRIRGMAIVVCLVRCLLLQCSVARCGRICPAQCSMHPYIEGTHRCPY